MSDELSDIIVQGALGVLVLFSIATWITVGVKWVQAYRARRQDALFRALLEKSTSLPSAEALRGYVGPTARLVQAGVGTWENNRAGASVDRVAVPREILELSLRRQIQKERHTTESGLAVLASIGTTSPFIGLFGTVWGILHALKSISAAGSASLDVVAGPIGEALIATGVGIAVAVPAVLAFNYFVRKLKVQAAELEDLANSLVSAALEGRLGWGHSPRSAAAEVASSAADEDRGSGPLLEAQA